MQIDRPNEVIHLGNRTVTRAHAAREMEHAGFSVEQIDQALTQAKPAAPLEAAAEFEEARDDRGRWTNGGSSAVSPAAAPQSGNAGKKADVAADQAGAVAKEALNGKSDPESRQSAVARVAQFVAHGVNLMAELSYFAHHPISAALMVFDKQGRKVVDEEMDGLTKKYGKAGAHLIAATATLICAASPPIVSHLLMTKPGGRAVARFPALVVAEAAIGAAQGVKALGTAAAKGMAKAVTAARAAFQKLTGRGKAATYSTDAELADDNQPVNLPDDATVRAEATALADKVKAVFKKAMVQAGGVAAHATATPDGYWQDAVYFDGRPTTRRAAKDALEAAGVPTVLASRFLETAAPAPVDAL